MEFALRPAAGADFDLAFEIKTEAMGPHIRVRWGWDEVFQTQHHAKKWAEKPWQIITVDGADVGTVSADFKSTHLQFGEFYVRAAFHGRGLGTAVLSSVLHQADERGLDTKLEYLKWNPVGRLYGRHGFRIVGESEIHYFLTRAPRSA
jgi:GNAT superfamily N-acetyltransferase